MQTLVQYLWDASFQETLLIHLSRVFLYDGAHASKTKTAKIAIRKALAKCMMGHLCQGCSGAIKGGREVHWGLANRCVFFSLRMEHPLSAGASVFIINQCDPMVEQGRAHSRCSCNVY